MPFSWAAARPVRDLDGVVDGLARGERPGPQALAQRLALQQLGHDVGRALVRADVVDGEDVGVVERAGGPRFLLEAAEALRVVGDARAAGP